jgi:ribosomal protein L6P/L9E
MILSKTFYSNNTIKIKLMNLAGITTLLFVLHTKKILLKIKSASIAKVSRDSLVLLNKGVKYSDYHNLLNIVSHYLKNNNLNYYSNFIKLHLVGLGFKNFILNDELYVLVGDCNYIIFKIPCNLKVYCKKNQIYVLGNNLTDIWNFSSVIKNIKKLNLYKGKGILEFRNFKFMQLKVGKKQRFM